MDTTLKCRFCGREVNETIHSKHLKNGFKVDYYLVWTGKLTPIIMKNPKDEREIIRFFKMDSSYPVVACIDCYTKEDVRNEIEKFFKEVPEESAIEKEEDEKEE